MVSKVGNVIENKSGLHVITEVINGIISDTEKLEEYVTNNALVQEDGEWKTIKEVIERRCTMYLKSGIKIIKE